MNDFYVYAYYLDKTPFYVGKGRKGRAFEHWNAAKRGSFSKVNRLLASKLKALIAEQKEPVIKFIYSGLTSDDALGREQEIIAQLGQKIHGTGPLLNILSVGSRPATRLGKRIEVSEESKQRISEGLKRAYAEGRRIPKMPVISTSSEIRRRESISKALTGRKTGPLKEEHAAKISEALSAYKKTENHKRNLSIALNGKSPSKTRKVLYTIVAEINGAEIIEDMMSVDQFAKKHHINASSLYRTLKRKTPVQFGKSKGWQLISLLNKQVVID